MTPIPDKRYFRPDEVAKILSLVARLWHRFLRHSPLGVCPYCHALIYQTFFQHCTKIKYASVILSPNAEEKISKCIADLAKLGKELHSIVKANPAQKSLLFEDNEVS